MNYQYSFADWIQWSMKLESDQNKEDRERKLIVFPEKKKFVK